MMKFICSIYILAMSLFGMAQAIVKKDKLPPPYATKSSSNFSKVIGWKDGATPIAPAGFRVTKYAEGFENPRWLYITPNGDLLVAQSNSIYSAAKKIGATIIGAGKSNDLKHSADIITLLRDTNNDGIPDVRETFLTEGLHQPFGMLIMGNWFYVANTDALMRYPYQKGQTKIAEKGEKIIGLPHGRHNQHWTRNIIANADNSKIYIVVGSSSNIADHGMAEEKFRADILEINPDGSGLKVFASGLRNPVGMDWEPLTGILWTAVNERDKLGDDLVPDYLTSVKRNGFYGWPYVYFGQNKDPRVKEQAPDLVKRTIVPEVDLGAHTASLGLAFYKGDAFPEKYGNGVFIGQHGSWNRKKLAGYKVVFVLFNQGKPSGTPEDFLTGFVVDPEKDEVRGRPVCVIIATDGSMYLTDDKSNTVWHVAYR